MTTGAKTVTILFTDLVGSTELLQEAGDEHAQRIFKAHHRILSEAVQRHSGHEVKWLGDGLMVAFDSAQEAVKCAIAMQQASRRPMAGERLQIRVGLNVGEALTDESDYFGTSVVVARRLCDSADAGQIYASELVAKLLSGRKDVEVRELGALDLKGIGEPVAAVEVLYEHDPAALLSITPFVGRVDEMERLQSALDAVRAGSGMVVMLVGEPGIGKTRTAQEFCGHATSAGARVLTGRCYEGEWGRPFSPFAECIERYVAEASDDDVRATFGADAATLARILPALGERLPDAIEQTPPSSESERYRLLDAVSSCFGVLSAERPLVLLLDDLHWADAGTLAMLRHVARELKDRRVLLLGTYRDVELDPQHPLTEALVDLRRTTQVDRLALDGLGSVDVGRLLDILAEQDGPPDLAAAITKETGGNPFFVREVLLHLVEEGKLFRQEGRWTASTAIAEMGVPDSVREVIVRRLARLSDAATSMLTSASAMTGGFTWAEIKAVEDRPESQLLDALDEALSAQIIGEVAPSTYDFAHALIRHTLYEALSTPRRALLHRRIAEALDGLYADGEDPHLSELAHHFYHSRPQGEDAERAIGYAERAGKRAARAFAHEEAVHFYELALELCESSQASDVRVCRVLLGLASERRLGTREPQEALQTFLRAADVARHADLAEEFAEAAIGAVEARVWAGGDNSDWADIFTRLLAEAIDRVPDHSTLTKIKVKTMFAWALDSADRREEARAMMEEAIADARRADDPDCLVYAIDGSGFTLWRADNLTERIQLREEALKLAGDNIERGMWAHFWLGTYLLEATRIDDAFRHFEESEELATKARLSAGLWYAKMHRATRATLTGRFADAELLAQGAVDYGRDFVAASNLHFAIQMFCLRWLQGRLAELLPGMRGVATTPRTASANAAVLAVCLSDTGDLEGARSVVAPLLDQRLRVVADDQSRIATSSLLAEPVAALAAPDWASLLYDSLRPFEDQCVVLGNGGALFGSLSRTLGLLASTTSRFDDAQGHFENALVVNERMGATPWLAWTRLNYGEMLLKRAETDAAKLDDRERAHALLEEALAFAREHGMGKVQRDAERALGLSESPAALSSDAGGTVVADSIEKSFAGGRYVAKRLLGRGAQKSVYLVNDTTLNRECAISVLNPALLDQGDIARIKQEAQTMAQFGTHPNIVTVHDYGEEDGAPYVVCEYVPGGELRDELRRANGPLALGRAVALASDLCQALSFAHGKGIVHRDLKPENVWLTRDGVAKLGDFGIALAAGRTRLTMPGGASGTPLYMAPEQASGGEIGPAADLYALGALLYELVAGRPPFTGGESNAIIYQHVNNRPEPPSAHNTDVPPELEALVLKLLAKQPAGRFASADEVLGALESAG